jgi:hypothetical protein
LTGRVKLKASVLTHELAVHPQVSIWGLTATISADLGGARLAGEQFNRVSRAQLAGRSVSVGPADYMNTMPIPLALPEAKPGVVNRRCCCMRCGAHVTGAVGQATLGGRCSTCGSYELRPLRLTPAAKHGR